MSSKEAIEKTGPAPDAVELKPQLATLKRSAIVRSKTNPRTHFDEAYIKELATSIKEHGILQPILVRPLPASRLQETFEDTPKGAPRPTHEIVCGECRWRACGLAGADDMPVLVRHLDDIQVLQVQLVENLKRKDLHPLEEAEGFERLMKDHGMSVEDIAAKVDKSTSQIYVTLKLLDLTPECRTELFAGKLTRSTALLVARSPAHLQAQIAKDIMRTDHQGEAMSYRTAVRHIHDHYMLQLSTAVFDIKDANLLPKAGACPSCPKRTGANSDMFEDVKSADTCTDPKCFDAKKVAHFEAIAKKAADAGQTVIMGKEAKALFRDEYSNPEGYKLLDRKDYYDSTYTSLRSAIGKADLPKPVIIVNPFTKQLQEAIPVATASKLLASAKKKKVEKKSAKSVKADFEQAWMSRAVEQVFTAITGGKLQAISLAVGRRIGWHLADNLYYGWQLDLAAKLLNVGKVASQHGVEDYLKTCKPNMVAPALLLVLMLRGLDDDDGVDLELLAEEVGVDVKAVQAEVKAELAANEHQPAVPAKKAATKPAVKRAIAKKPATAKASPKAAADKAPKATTPKGTPGKKGQADFMQALTPSPALAAVIGPKDRPRTEVVSALWDYIKKHKLQDATNKRMVNCDEKLQALFGKKQVSMFEMAGLLGKNVQTPAEAAKATKPAATPKAAKPAAKAPVTDAGKTELQVPANAAWPFPTSGTAA
jgi:ParB/RepB/Spo0J family partition protein